MTASHHILLVDDDRLIRMVMKSHLRQLGYSVHEATNGQEVLDFLVEGKGLVDAILMDWDMPVMDGITTCQHLQKHPKWQHIPVIMLTGKERTQDLEEGKARGVLHYLVKPAQADDLAKIFTHLFAKEVPYA